jgi:macrolide transport system ATP-binding/permease protein
VDSILLRALPVSNPESLVAPNWHIRGNTRGTVVHGASGSWNTGPKTGTTAGIFPFPAFELLRKSDAEFSSVFAYYPTRKVNLMVKSQADVANGEFVSGDYFRGLAVQPASGRLILPDDDWIGGPAIAVLSFTYSQRRFGDAANAIGQPIRINNVPFTVAGVTGPGFFGVDPAAAPDFYIPLHTNLRLKLRGDRKTPRDTSIRIITGLK